MLKISLLIVLMFLFASCTKIQPYITQYKLDTYVDANVDKQTMCKDKTLKVAHAFSPNSLMLDGMNYMSGKYKMDTFTQSQWIEAPNKSITTQTIKAVENSQLYKDVSGEESYVKSDFILENSIEDFMQYFSKDESDSHVKVVILATLVDAKTKTSLGHKRFEKIQKSDSIDAYGGVVSLNQALTEVLEDEVKWLGEMCR